MKVEIVDVRPIEAATAKGQMWEKHIDEVDEGEKVE